MIYLDQAATSFPKPEVVLEAMADFLRQGAANPGRGSHAMAVRAQQVVWQTRLSLARLVGTASPERIVFTLNCTEALNVALQGALRPGDHVVATTLEHNSVVRPLAALRRAGVAVTRVACDHTGVLDPRDIARAFQRDTKLVVVGHASNVTGTLQPVAEIGRLVREQGALLLVDAAQSLGIEAVSVDRDCIDLLAFPGHKALFGPPGTGGLFVGERAQLTPCRQGGTGSHSESEEQPEQLPERLESGTLNTVGLAGLRAGVDFVLGVGLDRLAQHERTLATRLYAGLQQIDKVTLQGPAQIAGRVGVISFLLQGWEPTELAAVLDQAFGIASRAGLHCAPDAHRTLGTFPAGTVRLSVGWFNTAEQIDQAVDAIRELARADR